MYRFIVIVLILFLISCSTVPYLSDYPLNGRTASESEKDGILSRAAASREAMQTFKVLSRCTLRYDGDDYISRYAFVAEIGRQLRIEQFPLTGFYSLSLIVNDGKQSIVVFPSEKKAVISRSGGEGINDFFHQELSLSERQITLLLAGLAPLEFIKPPSEINIDKGSASTQYFIRTSRSLMNLSDQGRLNSAYFFDRESEQELMSISYLYDTQQLPRSFTVQVPEQFSFTCTADQRAVNNTLREGIFTLEIPSDYSVDDRR